MFVLHLQSETGIIYNLESTPRAHTHTQRHGKHRGRVASMEPMWFQANACRKSMESSRCINTDNRTCRLFLLAACIQAILCDRNISAGNMQFGRETKSGGGTADREMTRPNATLLAGRASSEISVKLFDCYRVQMCEFLMKNSMSMPSADVIRLKIVWMAIGGLVDVAVKRWYLCLSVWMLL